MPSTAARLAMSFEAYSQLPEDGARTEYVHGRVIELPVANFAHNYFRDHIARRMQERLEVDPVGFAAGECEFTTVAGRTRRADVCFYRASRFPVEYFDKGGILPVPPDLAIEVASPNDKLADIREKVNEYLEAGVETVWVLYPLTGDAEKCEKGRREAALHSLTAACLPGFELDVPKLFASLRRPPSA